MNRTRADIEQLGFSVLSSTFSQDEILELVRAVEMSSLKQSKAGVRHALRYEPVRDLATKPKLLSVAREVLGHEAAPFRATLFDKSPRANWLVVWHQDTALPLRKRHDTYGWGPWSVKDGITYAHAPATALSQVLALRVHLDDSDADNGPLRVLPGSHMKGVLSDDDIEQLAYFIPAIDCLVPQGGVMAMSPLIVHASSKARLDRRRRVIHIEYAACRRFEGGLELEMT
jgi:ectoine hydroxylase-related dioxygenase (phytanoyl-CoA dioxygenase family)